MPSLACSGLTNFAITIPLIVGVKTAQKRRYVCIFVFSFQLPLSKHVCEFRWKMSIVIYCILTISRFICYHRQTILEKSKEVVVLLQLEYIPTDRLRVEILLALFRSECSWSGLCQLSAIFWQVGSELCHPFFYH